jgi:hypothetical protein
MENKHQILFSKIFISGSEVVNADTRTELRRACEQLLFSSTGTSSGNMHPFCSLQIFHFAVTLYNKITSILHKVNSTNLIQNF